MIISTRLSTELVKEIDQIAEKTGRSRSEVIQIFLEYAVDNLEIKEEKRNEKQE